MSLKEIVKHALQAGYLTSNLKAEVIEFCDSEVALSSEDDTQLEMLLGAILTGEVSGLYCHEDNRSSSYFPLNLAGLQGKLNF
jgi:hypothetical protein